jgi:uncharacterized membrane protein
MLLLIILLAIAFIIWLCWMTFQHNKEIQELKRQLQFLSDKVYAESRNKKPIENRQDESVMSSFSPQSPSNNTYAPPINSYAPPKAYAPPDAPSFAQPYMPDIATPVKKDSKGDVESWFGRNVIGIMASLLVFIGLVFLGVLAYEHITNTGKIIAMYVISSVILGLGIGLTIKKRNNFTLILMGCGCGSFFISILLTHIYFNRINDIVAFSLLLV